MANYEERPKISGVVFDMDGLMFDTERMFLHVWEESGKAWGIDGILAVSYTHLDGCLEAVKYDCKSVCVRSADVLLAMEICKNSDVFVKTVVGFPHGNCLPEVKNFEAQIAIAQGCKEIDMVMNIGMFKSGEYDILSLIHI